MASSCAIIGPYVITMHHLQSKADLLLPALSRDLRRAVQLVFGHAIYGRSQEVGTIMSLRYTAQSVAGFGLLYCTGFLSKER